MRNLVGIRTCRPRGHGLWVSVMALLGRSVAVFVASQLIAQGAAWANPFGCMPNSRLFSTLSTDTAANFLADSKKMSRVEFGSLPILPADSALLVKGTELNVLVDTVCLLDPERGPRELAWLNQLKGEAFADPKSPVRSFHYKLERDWDFYVLQNAFEAEPCVQLVSPEGKFFPSSRLSDPFVGEQAHLERLRFHEAMPAFLLPFMLRQNEVTIAIIDTGVDFSHEDLKWNRWTNRREIPGNGIDDDRNGYIDDVDGYNFASKKGNGGPEGGWPENKHGSHVAGLAASRLDNRVGGVGIHGVAKIMSLNVFGLNGFTRSSILENAIRYAGDQGAEVINLSLGGREYSRTMRSALQHAIARGSVIVTAAGNDGIELCEDPGSFDFISPAVYGNSIEGMIVTGSTDAMSGRYSLFSNFSKRLVEISAPGAFTSQGQLVGLLSTTPNNTYGRLAGTSMATPILSGAVAMTISWMKAYRYAWTPAKIESIIKAAAKKDLSMADMVQEGRTLDLLNLATYLNSHYPPRFPH